MMKLLQKITIMFSMLIVLLFTVSFLYPVLIHAQQAQYPISQLGNCRDAQECYYFCEVPRNFPACWSYGKFILHKNVLGESTKSPEEIAKEHGITFPITELDNCSSPQACMQYCDQIQNYSACTDFGRKKGLIQNNENNQHAVDEQKVLSDAKAMLGCDSKEDCMAFCNDPANQSICQEFAQKEGFNQSQNTSPQPSIPPTIYSATKQELDCDSETSCMQVCNNPNNYQKCQQFAEKHNLVPQQQTQQSYPTGMVTPFSTPPCNTPDSCMQWCKANPDKCKYMHPQQYNNYPGTSSVSPYPSYGLLQNYPTYNSNYPQQPSNYQPPCTDNQSCNQYCQSHPDQCPGFQQNTPAYQNRGYIPPSPYQPTGSQQQPQTQLNPPQGTGYNSTDQQQQMCTSTPNCSWNGSTCICSSGQQPNH